MYAQQFYKLKIFPFYTTIQKVGEGEVMLWILVGGLKIWHL
jgi:hypothetical protein